MFISSHSGYLTHGLFQNKVNMSLPVGKIKDCCLGPRLPLKAGGFFYDFQFTGKEFKAQRSWGFAQSHMVSEPERGPTCKTPRAPGPQPRGSGLLGLREGLPRVGGVGVWASLGGGQPGRCGHSLGSPWGGLWGAHLLPFSLPTPLLGSQSVWDCL